MKYTLSALIIILLSINCIAKKNNVKRSKKTKLSYQDYITQYGDNDTSIAMINIFFDKRNETAIGKMSFLPLTASISLLAPPIGIALTAISSPLFISGLITKSRYSHKNLLIALKNYSNLNMLSQNFKKDVFEQIKEQKLILNENASYSLIALKEISKE